MASSSKMAAEGTTLCCVLCNGSILLFEEGTDKFKNHMRYEHGAAFNLEFMMAACRMKDVERASLVDIFQPKPGGGSAKKMMSSTDKPSKRAMKGELESGKTKEDCSIENKAKTEKLELVKPSKKPRKIKEKIEAEVADDVTFVAEVEIREEDEPAKLACKLCKYISTTETGLTTHIAWHKKETRKDIESTKKDIKDLKVSLKTQMKKEKNYDGGIEIKRELVVKTPKKNLFQTPIKSEPKDSIKKQTPKKAAIDLVDVDTSTKDKIMALWTLPETTPKTPKKTSKINDTKQEDKENSRAKRSRRSMEEEEEAEDLDLNVGEMAEMIKNLTNHKDGWPFRRPIRKQEVPDYHLHVKTPMDLEAIRTRLDGTTFYTRNQQIIEDIRLVFSNCVQYNREEAVEYKCARRLEKFFEKELKKIGLVDEKQKSKKDMEDLEDTLDVRFEILTENESETPKKTPRKELAKVGPESNGKTKLEELTNVCSQTPAKIMSGKTPKTPKKTPAKIASGKTPKTPQKTPTKIVSGKTPKTPKKTLTKIVSGKTQKTPKKTPIKTVSGKTPKTPKKTPTKVATDKAAKTPKKTPAKKKSDSSPKTPKKTPNGNLLTVKMDFGKRLKKKREAEEDEDEEQTKKVGNEKKKREGKQNKKVEDDATKEGPINTSPLEPAHEEEINLGLKAHAMVEIKTLKPLEMIKDRMSKDGKQNKRKSVPELTYEPAEKRANTSVYDFVETEPEIPKSAKKRWQCEPCDAEFPLKRDLNEHIQKAHTRQTRRSMGTQRT